jgi:hypothetical protein
MKHPIPDEALDDRLGFTGTSGAGKIYSAGTVVERVLEQRGRGHYRPAGRLVRPPAARRPEARCRRPKQTRLDQIAGEQRLTTAVSLYYATWAGAAPLFGGIVKDKKPKWPASLGWEKIVVALIFLTVMWLVSQIPMPRH